MSDEHDEPRTELNEHERQMIAALADSPGWDALRVAAEVRMQQHFRSLARMFATRGVQPDYAQLQWQRGVFAGMKFILDNPLIQAARLAKLLEDQEGSG